MELNLYVQFAVFTLLFSFTFFEACGYTPKLWDRQAVMLITEQMGKQKHTRSAELPIISEFDSNKTEEEWWVLNFKFSVRFVIQLLSCVQLFVTSWTAACQASLSFTISQSLQTHVHWLCQWCCLAISSSVVPFSSCPQSFPASGSFPMSQFLE